MGQRVVIQWFGKSVDELKAILETDKNLTDKERKQIEAKKRHETIAKLKDRLAMETDKQVKTQTRIEALNAEIQSLESMLM